MHIYFSGIGGAGIGPLALIAKQAGYEVSGSDAKDGAYIHYLVEKGISDIHIGQTIEQIEAVHKAKPIDWFVYSSALPKTDPDHPELMFCQQNSIKTSKRDDLLNKIIQEKNLKLLAIAGTHGKTTTTAMAIWIMQKLGHSPSYSVGAKLEFGDMGHYEAGSKYFVYEADEFDRNFLAFHPFYSIISGVSWDHHEIFPTQEEYNQAFRDFLGQSQRAILWKEDADKLGLDQDDDKFTIVEYDDPAIDKLELTGLFNRRDALLVAKAVSQITGDRLDSLIDLINGFPGLSRRFEKIADNLYSDYAHTPEKILGCMSVAKEIAAKSKQRIIVVYEPLTNRRMHYLATQHKDVFNGASEIYWLPSFLAREDPEQKILEPQELIKNLNSRLQKIAHPAKLDNDLKHKIQAHLDNRDLVVGMAGGSSLDEWLRKEFKPGS